MLGLFAVFLHSCAHSSVVAADGGWGAPTNWVIWSPWCSVPLLGAWMCETKIVLCAHSSVFCPHASGPGLLVSNFSILFLLGAWLNHMAVGHLYMFSLRAVFLSSVNTGCIAYRLLIRQIFPPLPHRASPDYGCNEVLTTVKEEFQTRTESRKGSTGQMGSPWASHPLVGPMAHRNRPELTTWLCSVFGWEHSEGKCTGGSKAVTHCAFSWLYPITVLAPFTFNTIQGLGTKKCHLVSGRKCLLEIPRLGCKASSWTFVFALSVSSLFTRVSLHWSSCLNKIN